MKTELAKQNYDLWVTKDTAAEALGISVRSIERMVADGRLEQVHRNYPGRPPIALINPEDVKKASDMMVSKATLLEGAGSRALSNVGQHLGPFAALAAHMAEFSQHYARERTLFLTLDAAATYSGLSKRLLRRSVKAGQLPAIRDRALKVHREQLERFGKSVANGAVV